MIIVRSVNESLQYVKRDLVVETIGSVAPKGVIEWMKHDFCNQNVTSLILVNALLIESVTHDLFNVRNVYFVMKFEIRKATLLLRRKGERLCGWQTNEKLVLFIRTDYVIHALSLFTFDSSLSHPLLLMCHVFVYYIISPINSSQYNYEKYTTF